MLLAPADAELTCHRSNPREAICWRGRFATTGDLTNSSVRPSPSDQNSCRPLDMRYLAPQVDTDLANPLPYPERLLQRPVNDQRSTRRAADRCFT